MSEYENTHQNPQKSSHTTLSSREDNINPIDYPVHLHRGRWGTGPVGDHTFLDRFLKVKQDFLNNLVLP